MTIVWSYLFLKMLLFNRIIRNQPCKNKPHNIVDPPLVTGSTPVAASIFHI
jgi:hypothetical protein